MGPTLLREGNGSGKALAKLRGATKISKVSVAARHRLFLRAWGAGLHFIRGR